MTTPEIATRLVELLKAQAFITAYHELFSEDTESVDPIYRQSAPMKGLNLLLQREEQFLENTIIHSIRIADPLLAGNYFAINLIMDFSMTGKQNQLEELCVYQVVAGKIVRQQFFIAGMDSI